MIKNEDMAMVCLEVNRAYCQATGDDSQVAWDEAPDWQKETFLNGVAFHLASDRSPEESHAEWMTQKQEEGWIFGEEKNEENKTHPCLVPYDELPVEQKVKDFLFAAIVKVLSGIEVKIISEPAVKAAPARPEVVVDDLAGKMPVRYIGKRETYRDGMYGTGIVWEKGQTQMVPENKARKLLRHTDQYEEGSVEDAGNPVVDEPQNNDETEEHEEATRNSIRQMTTKAPLVEFAKNNFKVDLADIGKRKVADLQAECIGLIDQFGMPS